MKPTMDRLRAASGASDNDPLTLAMRPPESETPNEREERLGREAEAKRVNDAIDDQIKAERDAMKKRKGNEVKILMLGGYSPFLIPLSGLTFLVLATGQSESGKSTTIKNFQILYAPNAFHSERITWRAVIFLNLVRSVRRILSVLVDSHSNTAQLKSNGNDLDVEEDSYPVDGNTSSPSTSTASSPQRPGSSSRAELEPLPADLHRLAMRLSPLALVEDALLKALSSGNPADDDHEATHLGLNHPLTQAPNGRGKEYFVSASQWKKTLTAKLSRSSGESDPGSRSRPHTPPKSKEHTFAALYACSGDMAALWANPYVRDILARKNLRPEDSSGL